MGYLVLWGFKSPLLPHSNTQRWHDLRVEQVRREREVQATAQAFAGQLAARPIPHLGDALKNALSESVFRLALEGADEQQVRDELCRLAQLATAVDRDEIARQRLELDRRKLELAEQQAEVARLLIENAMSVPQSKRFLQGMMDSPAFEPYFKAWTAMQAARDAAGPQEDLEPDEDPELGDDPDGEPGTDDDPGPDDDQDPDDLQGSDNDQEPDDEMEPNHTPRPNDELATEDEHAEGSPLSPTTAHHRPRSNGRRSAPCACQPDPLVPGAPPMGPARPFSARWGGSRGPQQAWWRSRTAQRCQES